MYLEIFLTDFAVFCGFLGNSRDFAEIPKFRGSATARNIRSPDLIMGIAEVSFSVTLMIMIPVIETTGSLWNRGSNCNFILCFCGSLLLPLK